MLPQNVTLQQIARKVGVPQERHPYLIEIYEANRHNPTMLFESISQLPTQEEKYVVMVFVGAVVAGAAMDPKLYQPTGIANFD